jgi:hypothetical protein
VGSHNRLLWLTLLLSVFLLTANTIVEARAQGTITVNPSPQTVTLDYHIAFYENATALSNANVIVDSSNSSQPTMVNSFQAAIQRLVPGATVDPSTFRFAANVRQQRPNATMWIMSENFTLTVTGAASNKPGTTSFNLGLMDMNFSDSLKFGGVELNTIGPTYLVAPINSQPMNTIFYLDRSLVRGGPYLNPVIPTITTKKFNLLDFSWVPKLSFWDHKYRPLETSSSWTLKTGPGTFAFALPYNLTMGIKSPENTLLGSLTAFYNIDLALTTPARAVADGSTISYPVPASTDFVMPTIVGGTVVLAAGSFVAEKRLVRSAGSSKKKRKG